MSWYNMIIDKIIVDTPDDDLWSYYHDCKNGEGAWGYVSSPHYRFFSLEFADMVLGLQLWYWICSYDTFIGLS